MPDVATVEALLVNALQDLHDAERAMAERLPLIADDVSDGILRGMFDEDASRSASQQRKVANLLERRNADVEGAPISGYVQFSMMHSGIERRSKRVPCSTLH